MPQNRLLLQFLSEEALDQIEETACRLLDRVGIALEHEQAREMLHGLGCRIEGDRTLIPREVVSWALANVSAGREFLNLDGTPPSPWEMGRCVSTTEAASRTRSTWTAGTPSRPVAGSVRRHRVLDALPHVDQITPLFGPQDVPPALLFVQATATTFRNTHKPVSAAAIDKAQDVPYVVEMAAACCGARMSSAAPEHVH